MNELKRKIATIVLITFCLLFLIVGFSGNYGVSNMDSLHLSDFNGTATPNLLVNQRGSGVIAEFQDGGTPVATWNNGGSFTAAGSGDFTISPGNLKVGDGSPSFTQDGEDAYIEGTLETASDVVVGAQTTVSMVQGLPITPTGIYQPLTSSPISPDTASPIAAATTIGELLILHNINATRPITVDGTGSTVECKADVSLFPQDTLILIWNGTDWVCLSNYDNS